jgi:hypothetical protein
MSGMRLAGLLGDDMAMARFFATLSLTCLVASCARASPAGRASATPGAAASAVAEPATAPNAARVVDVDVQARGPMRVRYDSNISGAVAPSLAVVVTNRSSQSLDVSDLLAHLEAVRDGVAFRCASEVGVPLGVREPSTLAPGASHTFDRALDCALPLVGTYSVRIAVSFGNGRFRTARDVRAFSLTVTAPPNAGPREVEGQPGLWAAMGASRQLVGGAKSGHGHTVVTLVNSSDKPIEVPRMRLAVRVYRGGNPIPCVDQPVALGTPAVLGPGDAYSEPADLSCLGLAVPGSYEVAARLLVPGGSEGDRETALGRLHIDVVADPNAVIDMATDPTFFDVRPRERGGLGEGRPQ